MDVGKQKQMCLSEILGLQAVSFSPGAHILVCVCDHTHLFSSSPKELFLRGVRLFHEFTPPGLEMLQRRYVTFHVTGAHICSLYEVTSAASVTLSSYFLLSGTREYSHVPSSPIYP